MKRVYIIISLLAALQIAVAQEPEYRSKNYPDGGLMYDGYFIGDKPVDVTRYYVNGRVQCLQHFEDNGSSTVKLFNKDATPFADGSYNADRERDGLWKFYNNVNGNLSAIITYRDGIKDGMAVQYSESGATLDSMFYVNDKLSGERVLYYPNGKMESVANYVNGVLNGVAISYYEGGGKAAEGTYVDGERDGLWKFYDEKGVADEFKFKNGKCKKFEALLKSESRASDIDRHIKEPTVEDVQ